MDSIKGMFNSASLGGFIKFAFQTVLIGVIVGGIFDFTLFHNHPAGQAIIEKFNEPLLKFYDWMSNVTGFGEYARPDFVASAGAAAGGCSPLMDPLTGGMTLC